MKRFFDEEFKENALALLDSGQPISKVCNEFNITIKQLRRWETERKANSLDDAKRRIRRLENKIVFLKNEIKVLKVKLTRQNK